MGKGKCNMKKAMVKVVSAAVAGLLVLSGCSTSSKPASESQNSQGSQQPVNIVYYNMSYGDKYTDLNAIQDKLNQYTKSKINVTATIKEIEFSTYTQQVSTMLASGEPVDLISSWGQAGGIANMVGQHQIMPLDNYIDKEGAGIKSSLGKLLGGLKVNGSIYAIPFNSSKLYSTSLHFNKAMVDKYKMDLSSIKTYKDLAKIFAVIKKNEPNITPFDFTNFYWPNYAIGGCIDQYDSLGDGIGVLTQNKDYKVVDLYETPQYKDLVTTMHQWYQAGYFNKDAATSNDMGYSSYMQGKTFCFVNVDTMDDFDKPYDDPHYTATVPAYSLSLNKPIISNSVGFYCNSIPTTSPHPDAAMKWLNLMYTDPTAVNMLYYGIEGSDYVKNSDGTVQDAPGVTAANKKWSTDLLWSFGNTDLMYRSKVISEDFNTKIRSMNKNATYSIAFGFNFDTSKVKNAYTAVNNVINQYRRPLECGSVDPATKLPEFIQKLKNANIDQIITEKQNQLNTWVTKYKDK